MEYSETERDTEEGSRKIKGKRKRGRVKEKIGERGRDEKGKYRYIR